MNKKWYLISSKPNCEKKAAAILTRKKIEHYSPLNTIEKIERNKKKIVFESLFPSYLFVYISKTEMAAVREIDSVVNFVYWLRNPAVIKDNEIEHIAYFTKQYHNIKLRKINVDNSAGVEEINEYFKKENTDGKVYLVNRTAYKLLLPSLGYAMVAEKEKSANSVFDYSLKKAELFS